MTKENIQIFNIDSNTFEINVTLVPKSVFQKKHPGLFVSNLESANFVKTRVYHHKQPGITYHGCMCVPKPRQK